MTLLALLLLAGAPTDGGAVWAKVTSKARFDRPDAEFVKELGKSQYADGAVRKRCLRYGPVAILTTEDSGLIGSDMRLASDCEAEGTELTNNFFYGVRGPYLLTAGEPFGVLTQLAVFDLRTKEKVLELQVDTRQLNLHEKEKGHWILKADVALGLNCTRADPAPCVPDAGLLPPRCDKALASPPPARPDDVMQLTAPAELDLSQPGASPQFKRGAKVSCATQP
jgi:hypothetical protein